MDFGIDKDLLKGKAQDIVFRSPFSPETNSIRKRVFFVSTIIIVHNAFPIDLAHSHFLGVSFESRTAPSISGILGLFLFYLAIVLAIHSYQEISSWLSQGNAVKFARARADLQNIYSHHQNIHNVLRSIDYQIEQHRDLSSKIVEFDVGNESLHTLVKDHLSEMGSHVESFKNFVDHLKSYNRDFGREIGDAAADYERALSLFQSAMYGQILKVGILEVALPLMSVLLALSLCGSEVIGMLVGVLNAI